MNNKVAIILVNYNGEKFQNECIRKIKDMDYKNYDIVLVDNGSIDNSIKKVRKEFDDVIIIETGENNGVAKGNNIGIQYALDNNYEYILLLNNDTEVAPDMLSKMMQKASKNTLVTCKMYYFDPSNVLWCAGGKINWNKGTTTHFGMDELDKGQHDQSRFVEYTPTCCLLIHREVFNKIGLMDEKYFLYYDDTDFCVRANRAGFKIWYESSAKLWHKVSSTSGGSESNITIYYGTRNRLYFINKHCKNKIVPNIFFYSTRIIKYIKYKKINKSKILIKGIKDFYNNNMYNQDLS